MILKILPYKMKKILPLLVIFFILGIFPLKHAILAEPKKPNFNFSLDATIDRLEKKMSQVASIKASFIQEKELSIFKQKIILRGYMSLKKPGLFAWHVLEPVRYSMVITQDTVRQWDEDTGRVQQLSIAKNPAFEIAISQMKEWFMGAYSSLRKEYEITLVKESPLTLSFVPLKNSLADNMIRRVIISFRKDERYIDQIRIEEKNQDITLLRFFDTGLNVPVDAAAWEVKPRVQ